MNLRSTILKEHSRKNADKVVGWVGDSQKRFDELMHLFLTDEYRVVQHAAWPISYCAVAHPRLLRKHISRLIKELGNEKAHPAVRRNILRLLPHVSIPAKHHGDLIDKCIQFLTAPDEKAAVKAFALHVLEKLVAAYPDISREVELIILDQWDREPASFRSRGKKFLGAIRSPALQKI